MEVDVKGRPWRRAHREAATVLGQLAADRTVDEIVMDFPDLERDDVLAALEYAAMAVQERELPLASGQ